VVLDKKDIEFRVGETPKEVPVSELFKDKDFPDTKPTTPTLGIDTWRFPKEHNDFVNSKESVQKHQVIDRVAYVEDDPQDHLENTHSYLRKLPKGI